jgi:hypothetical protein
MRHGMAHGITSQDCHSKNTKLEHTLSYCVAQPRILVWARWFESGPGSHTNQGLPKKINLEEYLQGQH